MAQVVAIDPGHGGKNYGCRVGHEYERDVTKELAWELRGSLYAASAVEPVLTRFGENPSFNERAHKAERNNAVLAVSIHVNSWRDESMSGAQTYLFSDPTAYEVSEEFLHSVPVELQGDHSRPFILDREDDSNDPGDDWLQRPRNVIECYSCPVVLFEVGFASNPDDLAVIQSPLGRSAIVCAMRSAVIHGLRVLNKEIQ